MCPKPRQLPHVRTWEKSPGAGGKERRERTFATKSTTSSILCDLSVSSSGVYGGAFSAPGSSNLVTMLQTMTCCFSKRARSSGEREGPFVER